MEIKQKVYVEGTSEKRALLKQACLSKSAAELEVDSRGTLLLISTLCVKLVTRPCVLCKHHVIIMSLRSLGCWRSTLTQAARQADEFHPVSLRSHGCPLPIPQICIGSVAGSPCETDIKRKLNAIPDSPLAGKTEARERAEGVDSWRSDLIIDIGSKKVST